MVEGLASFLVDCVVHLEILTKLKTVKVRFLPSHKLSRTHICISGGGLHDARRGVRGQDQHRSQATRLRQP